VSSLSAISSSTYNMALVAISPDQHVFCDEQSSSGQWSGFLNLNGAGPSASAVTDPAGQLGVVAIGTDGAVYDTEQATFAAVSGTLFGPGGPSYLDVRQTNVGDCWLMASLAEVAARTPSVIDGMFIPDGTTTDNGSVVPQYLVRFYDSAGNPHYVAVDTELPSVNGVPLGDQPVNGMLWVALAEKAYVEANAAGIVTTNHPGSNDYAAVNGGTASWALQAITGQPANDVGNDPSNVAAAWNAGQYVTLCTNTPASSYIVGGHCYALVSYDPSHYVPGQGYLPFELFNPWGADTNDVWAPGHFGTTYGLFWVNATFLSQNFSGISIGTGAAQGAQEGSQALSFPDMADFESIAGLLAPHAKGQAIVV
jgi:hypothetical protein